MSGRLVNGRQHGYVSVGVRNEQPGHDETHDAEGYLLPENLRYSTINPMTNNTNASHDSNVENNDATTREEQRGKCCTRKDTAFCVIVVALICVIVVLTTMLFRGSSGENGSCYSDPSDGHVRTISDCLNTTNITPIKTLEIVIPKDVSLDECLEKSIGIGHNITKVTSFTNDVLCPSGDYLLVRRNDDGDFQYRPNCRELVLGLLTEHMLHSPEQCFYLACKADANVIYYEPNKECAAYICDSHSSGLDWEYKWSTIESSSGRTYARPYSQSTPCYNSYFMKRTVSNVSATCFPISEENVESLSECMGKACVDKANTFNIRYSNYGSDTRMICETQHCGWSASTNDYVFNPSENNDGQSDIYSLSHTMKTCRNLLTTQPVEFPVYLPGECGFPGYFTRRLLQTTGQEIPNEFCESGSNTFTLLKDDDKYFAYKCDTNHEGTNWKFYDDNCYGDNRFSKWWIVPYPGTPYCKSNMFTLRRMRASCQKSNCDATETKRIPGARDLRQCMLYACEESYNTINYFSNTTVVVCELRNCYRLENDYDFRYESTGNTHGYDVYALQSYPTICRNEHHATNHMHAKDMTSYYVNLN